MRITIRLNETKDSDIITLIQGKKRKSTILKNYIRKGISGSVWMKPPQLLEKAEDILSQDLEHDIIQNLINNF